jgi:TPR repeat protein
MLLVAALTAAAIWLVPSSKDPAVVELPPAPGPAVDAPETADTTHQPPIPVAAPAAGSAPAGSTARQLIAAQRDAGKPDPQAAYERARQLARAGQAEDAYLLDFYAARLGHAEAAFALAEQADPAYWRGGGTLQAAAPDQALKWYRAAADAGQPQAAERLTALRRWAEKAAEGGDPEAQRLMLAWQ